MNKKHKTIIILISMVFFILLSFSVGVIFIFPDVYSAYSNPRVNVKLDTSLFGVVGIKDNVDLNNFEWKKIDNADVLYRSQDTICVITGFDVPVSIEKTTIRDTQSENQHELSEVELYDFLSALCDGELRSRDIVLEINQEKSNYEYINDLDMWNGDVVITVSGRYSGVITLSFKVHNDTVELQQEATNINEVWKVYEHIPYGKVALCLVISALATALLLTIGYVVYKKTDKPVAFVMIVLIPTLLMIAFFVFLLQYLRRAHL